MPSLLIRILEQNLEHSCKNWEYYLYSQKQSWIPHPVALTYMEDEHRAKSWAIKARNSTFE